MRRAIIAALVSAPACGGETVGGEATGPGVTSRPADLSTGTGVMSSSSSSSSTSTSSAGEYSSTGSGGSSAGQVLDMGLPPDFGPGPPAGCQGKIDFLFLISRLGTMKTEQEQLLASFPGFMQTIEEKFAGFDTHIMVANPDGTWSGDGCETAELCGKYGHCGPHAEEYACQGWSDIVLCDMELGAGILFNAGAYATNHPCTLFGGNRYMIAGEPDPLSAFECIATVGTFAPEPRLGDALIAAVSEKLNGPEGCNEGFLRPDALLVVTFVRDNEEQSTKSSPIEQYEAVVAAKGGDPNSVVMLPIVPQTLVGDPKPGCTHDEGDKPELEKLAEMFLYHAEGDVCAPSYAPFFEAAAEQVFKACDAFIPQ